MDNTNTNELSIKKLSFDDRPREKLLSKGIGSLSNAELIAILIGSGSSEQNAVELSKSILKASENDLHQLALLSIKELQKFKGIGEAKAITIVSALELGRRRKASKAKKLNTISSSRDVYDYIYPYLVDVSHEEFWIILLNRANKIIKGKQISSGGISATIVDAKLIFKEALSFNSSAIILIHNHPSGNINASKEDINLTKKIKEAGKFLDITILDHLIFTNHNYISFADEGMM